jgi:catechol 2,3-dioxygenase-like lactoylglutathione lyase family enzyme
MTKFDHMTIPVRDYRLSRDWYVETLGMAVEFEIEDQLTVALRDHNNFTLFMHQAPMPERPGAFAFYFQVDSVDEFYRLHRDRLDFNHEPKAVSWGYGAELCDPNGYRIALWDEKTMPKQRT